MLSYNQQYNKFLMEITDRFDETYSFSETLIWPPYLDIYKVTVHQ